MNVGGFNSSHQDDESILVDEMDPLRGFHFRARDWDWNLFGEEFTVAAPRAKTRGYTGSGGGFAIGTGDIGQPGTHGTVGMDAV